MKMLAKCTCLFIVALMLSACGSSATISKNLDSSLIANQSQFKIGKIECQLNDVPDHFLEAIKGHLKSELQKRNLYSNENSNNSCDVNVVLNYYRMRSGFTRMMFGVMAGKDGVESIISIVDPNTNIVVGKSTVSTFNIMAVGEMDDIARMHAEKIAAFIAGEIKS